MASTGVDASGDGSKTSGDGASGALDSGNGDSTLEVSDAFSEAGASDADSGATAPEADGESGDAAPDASADAGAESGSACTNGTDPTWADWPMPNTGSDVQSGAPNPASYTDNGDGTVTDNVTGLMWQQALTTAGTLSGSPGNDSASSAGAKANAMLWSGAASTCQSLALAGHADWRMPTIIELMSIVDTGLPSAMDSRVFPDPSIAADQDALFMSGTPDVAGQTVANMSSWTPSWWLVHSLGGQVGVGSASTGASLDFRCVRAPRPIAPSCRYTYPGPDIVLDTRTNLTWQRPASSLLTHPDALTYCAGLNLTGAGWRLPTVKELMTIVDYTAGSPIVDATAFPSTPTDNQYWSSTANSAPSGQFWTIWFNLGSTDHAAPTETRYVRCVR
jgi:hypothetical protein